MFCNRRHIDMKARCSNPSNIHNLSAVCRLCCTKAHKWTWQAGTNFIISFNFALLLTRRSMYVRRQKEHTFYSTIASAIWLFIRTISCITCARRYRIVQSFSLLFKCCMQCYHAVLLLNLLNKETTIENLWRIGCLFFMSITHIVDTPAHTHTWTAR